MKSDKISARTANYIADIITSNEFDLDRSSVEGSLQEAELKSKQVQKFLETEHMEVLVERVMREPKLAVAMRELCTNLIEKAIEEVEEES